MAEVFTTKDPILLLARATLWIADRADPDALRTLQRLASINKKTYTLLGDHADLRAAQANYLLCKPEDHAKTEFFYNGGQCKGDYGICSCFGTARPECACACHVKCSQCFSTLTGRNSNVDNDAITDAQCLHFQRCVYALHTQGSYRVARYHHHRARVFFPIEKIVRLNTLASKCHVPLMKKMLRLPGVSINDHVARELLCASVHTHECEMLGIAFGLFDKYVSENSVRCLGARIAATCPTATPATLQTLVTRYPDMYKDALHLKVKNGQSHFPSVFTV